MGGLPPLLSKLGLRLLQLNLRRIDEKKPRFFSCARNNPEKSTDVIQMGDCYGIYSPEKNEEFTWFRDPELDKTIPVACEAIHVRNEIYDALSPVRGRIQVRPYILNQLLLLITCAGVDQCKHMIFRQTNTALL